MDWKAINDAHNRTANRPGARMVSAWDYEIDEAFATRLAAAEGLKEAGHRIDVWHREACDKLPVAMALRVHELVNDLRAALTAWEEASK